MRELQSDSDIDDVGRIVEKRRGRRTSATKCERNAFVRFQFDDENEGDDEGKTVVDETTSVPACLTRRVRS